MVLTRCLSISVSMFWRIIFVNYANYLRKEARSSLHHELPILLVKKSRSGCSSHAVFHHSILASSVNSQRYLYKQSTWMNLTGRIFIATSLYFLEKNRE